MAQDKKAKAAPIEDDKLDQATGAGGHVKVFDGRTNQRSGFVQGLYQDLLGRETSTTQNVGTNKPTVKP